MKLYPKVIKDNAALKREKERLRDEITALDKEEVLPIEGLLKGGLAGAGSLGTFSKGMSIAQGALKFIKAIRGRKEKDEGKKKKRQPEAADAIGENKPGFATRAAKEFIGGYLKWKAISLGLKGISYLIKSRRDRKDPEK